LPNEVDIRDVTPAPGQKARILLAGHRLSDPEAHGPSPSPGGMPPIQRLVQGSGADYADSGSRHGEPKIFCGRGLRASAAALPGVPPEQTPPPAAETACANLDHRPRSR